MNFLGKILTWVIVLIGISFSLNLLVSASDEINLQRALVYWNSKGYVTYADPAGNLIVKNVYPSVNNTYALGSTTQQFKEAWIKNFYGQSATISGLLSSRIPIVGAGGLLGDSSNLTFNTTTGTLTTPNITVTKQSYQSYSDLTILADTITVTQTLHRIDTEGAAATDNLSTVNGGSIGMLLILQSKDGTRVITIQSGIGNLLLQADFIMNSTQDRLVLLYDGSSWIEVSRSSN